MTKNINIKLDIKKYPELQFIKDDCFENKIYELIDKGYNTVYNTIKKPTESEDKLDRLVYNVEKLLGISMVKKGHLVEDIIGNYIQEKLQEYCYMKTRGIAHSGDAIISKNINNELFIIMLEVKNYSKPVDQNEIDKFKFDMKNKGIKYGIIMSIKSGFIGKKQLYFEKVDDINIIYIPNLFQEIYKLDMACILLERIYELEKDDNCVLEYKKNIVFVLKEIEKICDDISLLKDKYNKMEDSIRTNLYSFEKALRDHEYEMKSKINILIKKIDDTVPELDNCDNVIYTKLKEYLKNNGCVIKNNEIIKDKKIIAEINVKKTILTIKFINDNISMTLNKNTNFKLIEKMF